jgi:hypothetical protein
MGADPGIDSFMVDKHWILLGLYGKVCRAIKLRIQEA